MVLLRGWHSGDYKGQVPEFSWAVLLVGKGVSLPLSSHTCPSVRRTEPGVRLLGSVLGACNTQ